MSWQWRWVQAVGAALLVAALVVGASTTAAGQEVADDWSHIDETGAISVDFYFVWSETCPHCQEARPFIEALPERFPWLTLHSLPTSSEANTADAVRLAGLVGQEITGVPAFFVCGQLYVGYDSAESRGAFLADQAEACHASLEATATPPVATVEEPLTLPVVGDVDAHAVSLPVFTITVAALDAFNPCAFFVLLFLLSLLVHARSRLRMVVIGGTFVLISGIAYFVFMAAWLNVFRLSGELRAITTLAGLVAMALALLNIKDYFFAGRGPSLSIPEGAKPGLFRRMRELTAGTAYPALLAGTVTLAIAANSYELLCTAGFPVVFTRVLTLNDLSTASRYGYLVLYNLVYMLPMFAIVGLFVWKLGSRKLSEMEGRALKLVSGLMMLGLGLILVIEPSLLDNLTTALAVLAGAIATSAVVVAIDRWIHHQTPARSH